MEENDTLTKALSLLEGITDVLLVLDKEKKFEEFIKKYNNYLNELKNMFIYSKF